MPRKPDPARLYESASRLNIQDLEDLCNRLNQLLEQRQSESQELNNSIGSGGWQEEYRKCGKPNCWCTHEPTGKGHGPYLYRSVWKDGKPVKEYSAQRSHRYSRQTLLSSL